MGNIIQYNEVIKGLEKQFDILSVCEPLNPLNSSIEIYQDGYHPNREGNKLVFESVKDAIFKMYHDL